MTDGAGRRRGRVARALAVAWLLLPRCRAELAAAPAAPAATAAADPLDAFELSRLAVRSFTSGDGLPQNSVEGIAFDADGRLWVGTQDGAAVWNGRQWTAVDMPKREVSNWVRTLVTTPDGALWFGTVDAGLVRLHGGRFTMWGESSGLPSNRVISLWPASPASLWIGTAVGLARLASDRLAAQGEGAPSGRISCLLEERDAAGGSVLWAGTTAGLARFSGGRWQTFDTAHGLPDNRVLSLLRTDDGDGGSTLWVGTWSGLARQLSDGRFAADELPGSPKSPVGSLASTGTGRGRVVWAGLYGGGLARRAAGRWHTLTKGRGFPNDDVSSVVADPGDPLTIWAGTLGGGLARVRLGGWRTLEPPGGDRAAVWCFLETSSAGGASDLWLGTSEGLLRVHDGRFTRFGAGDGLPATGVGCLAATPGSGGRTIWAGTDVGLYRLSPGSARFTRETELPEAGVLALLVSEDGGTLWVGAEDGPYRRREGTWSRVAETADAVTSLRVTRVGGGGATRVAQPPTQAAEAPPTRAPDGEEVLWAGTRGSGLLRVAGGQSTVIGRASGLPNDFVTDIHLREGIVGRRELWLATYGGGVGWLDPDAPQVSVRRPAPAVTAALPSNAISQIRQDAKGRLYLFTNRGVARLTPRAPAASDPSSFGVYTFTVEDGLPSNECNQNGALVDRRGRIWAGTVEGAAVLDPELELEDSRRKRLLLERSLVDGREVTLPLREALPYRRRSLTFEYALVSTFRPGDTRYRVQLAGLDEHPSDWTQDAKQVYTTLPGGDYVFRVWGRDYAGNVSGPLAVPFRVRPPFWQTWWAALAAAVTVMGLGYAVARARVAALSRRAALLEGRVAERTRELEENLERLRVSEEQARQAARQLQDAERKIAELVGSAGQALQDIPAWSRAIAEDVGRTIGARSIGVFGVVGDDVEPLVEGDAEAPLLPALQALAGRPVSFDREGTVVVPVTGMTGELHGALTIDGKETPWGDVEKRLVASFAQQLGGALELQRMKESLDEARARRAATRREMLASGLRLVAVCPRCRGCFDQEEARCPKDGAALEEPSRLLPHRVLSRYRLTRVLGEGGMGAVFEARDERLERDVALKVILPEHFDRPQVRLRFEQEARALARLEHRGVIAIFDSGELEDGSAYLVMERLRGANLRLVLTVCGPARPQQAAAFLRESASALGAVHRAGLIHRDIKPENLFLVETREGRLTKLLDFGIAKPFLGTGTGLTQTNTIVGTPSYMSPEQIQGRDLDVRSDLYSLAEVVFEALSGDRWIRGRDLGEIFLEMMDTPLPRVVASLPGFPEKAQRSLAAALAARPQDRPRDVERWGETLAELLAGAPELAGGWPDSLFEVVDQDGRLRPGYAAPTRPSRRA